MFIKKSGLEETEKQLKCGENISPNGYLIWPVINMACIWMRRQVDIQSQVLAFSFYYSHQCPQLPTQDLFGNLLRAVIPVTIKKRIFK